nr:protein FAR1-RELATED SEQUENCE 5-like [Ipomoea batatas]
MVKPRAGMVVCDEDCAVSPGGSVEVRTHGGANEPDWALTDPSFWTPNVDTMIRPAIGLRFKTMNEGVEFYMSYGRAGGFDVRHSTMKRGRDGEVTMRYLVCSRQGTKGGGSSGPSAVNGEGGHVKQRRKRISNRVQCLAKIFLRQDNTGEFVCSTSSPLGMVMNLLWAEINTCVGMVGRNEGRLTRLLQAMNELKAEFVADGSSTRMVKGNTAAIQALCGVCPPQSISTKPPAQAKNRGSGKRIKSKRELAIEAREKGEHKCGACGLYRRHDRRNCPKFPRVGSGDKLNKKK